jgi:hypothetical protein
MPRATFVWGAHAPPRALSGASPESLFNQTPKAQINLSRKSSRPRGRDRQHARRVRSPIRFVAR